jgi:hypothetical protein
MASRDRDRLVRRTCTVQAVIPSPARRERVMPDNKLNDLIDIFIAAALIVAAGSALTFVVA